MTTLMQRLRNVLRGDAWYNEVTGIGTARDKSTAAAFGLSNFAFDYGLHEQLWAEDPVFGKIANMLPQDAFRAGYELRSPDPDGLEKLRAAGEAIGSEDPENPRIDAALTLAWQMSRAFGGSAIMIRTENEAPELPLSGRVLALTVLDRREVSTEWATDTHLVGRPRRTDYYMIGGLRVHASRIIPFYGEPVSRWSRAANGGWGLSHFTKPYEIVSRYMQALYGAGTLLTDSNQAVWKIGGLWQMLAKDDPEAENTIHSRMRLNDLLRSSIRAIVLDKDSEDFDRKAASFTGLAETLAELKSAIAMSANMPETRLWGTTPSGLNSAGTSEDRAWYDEVDRIRRADGTPRLRRLWAAIAMGEGLTPPSSIEWGKLYGMSAKEAAEVDKLRVEASDVAINAGVLSVSEARAAVVAEGSVFRALDPELVAAELAAEQARPNLEGEGDDEGNDEGDDETRTATDTEAPRADRIEIPLTPTDVAEVVRVNEARTSLGLAALPAAEGDEFIGAFKVRQQAATQARVSAEFPAVAVTTESAAPAPKRAAPPPAEPGSSPKEPEASPPPVAPGATEPEAP